MESFIALSLSIIGSYAFAVLVYKYLEIPIQNQKQALKAYIQHERNEEHSPEWVKSKNKSPNNIIEEEKKVGQP